MNKLIDKKWSKSTPQLVAHFQATMDTFPHVENRKMFGYPCCFKNNHLFTGLHEENWILRLEKSDLELFCSQFNTAVFEPFPGRKMKEYAILPLHVRENKILLQGWIEKSISYVESLPPK